MLPRLVFDGDCGFCTTSATWVSKRLRRTYGVNAEIVPWQRTDLKAIGTTAERAQKEVLWVDAYGHVSGGAQAFAEWLKFRGGPYGVAGEFMSSAVVAPVASVVYRLIAANRSHLPGGTPACALPPPGSTTS